MDEKIKQLGMSIKEILSAASKNLHWHVTISHSA
jgi:hypothetical protein